MRLLNYISTITLAMCLCLSVCRQVVGGEVSTRGALSRAFVAQVNEFPAFIGSLALRIPFRAGVSFRFLDEDLEIYKDKIEREKGFSDRQFATYRQRHPGKIRLRYLQLNMAQFCENGTEGICKFSPDEKRGELGFLF